MSTNDSPEQVPLLRRWELWGTVMLPTGIATLSINPYAGGALIITGVMGLLFFIVPTQMRWIVSLPVGLWDRLPVEVRRRGVPTSYKAYEITHDGVIWRERILRLDRTGMVYVDCLGPLCPHDKVALDIRYPNEQRDNAGAAARHVPFLNGDPDWVDADSPLICPKCERIYTLGTGRKQVKQSKREADAIITAEGFLKNS